MGECHPNYLEKVPRPDQVRAEIESLACRLHIAKRLLKLSREIFPEGPVRNPKEKVAEVAR